MGNFTKPFIVLLEVPVELPIVTLVVLPDTPLVPIFTALVLPLRVALVE